MRVVIALDDFLIHERLAEAGPTATGIELIERTEERFARNDVDVEAWFVIVPEFVAEGRLGICVLSHLELHRRELLFQFVGGWLLKILHSRICGLRCCDFCVRRSGLRLGGRTAAEGGARDHGERRT